MGIVEQLHVIICFFDLNNRRGDDSHEPIDGIKRSKFAAVDSRQRALCRIHCIVASKVLVVTDQYCSRASPVCHDLKCVVDVWQCSKTAVSGVECTYRNMDVCGMCMGSICMLYV